MAKSLNGNNNGGNGKPCRTPPPKCNFSGLFSFFKQAQQTCKPEGSFTKIKMDCLFMCLTVCDLKFQFPETFEQGFMKSEFSLFR